MTPSAKWCASIHHSPWLTTNNFAIYFSPSSAPINVPSIRVLIKNALRNSTLSMERHRFGKITEDDCYSSVTVTKIAGGMQINMLSAPFAAPSFPLQDWLTPARLDPRAISTASGAIFFPYFKSYKQISNLYRHAR